MKDILVARIKELFSEYNDFNLYSSGDLVEFCFEYTDNRYYNELCINVDISLYYKTLRVTLRVTNYNSDYGEAEPLDLILAEKMYRLLLILNNNINKEGE